MSSKKTTFIDTLDNWFDKFPSLPTNWRENLVKITPYFALIIGILGVLSGLDGIRQLITSSPLSYIAGTSEYISGLLSTVIYLIASVMLLMAYSGTKAKKYNGWKLLFWWEVLSIIGGIASLSSWISIIIWTIIMFYLLFQIRSYYK